MCSWRETLVAMRRKYGGCTIPATPPRLQRIKQALDVLGKRLVVSVQEGA